MHCKPRVSLSLFYFSVHSTPDFLPHQHPLPHDTNNYNTAVPTPSHLDQLAAFAPAHTDASPNWYPEQEAHLPSDISATTACSFRRLPSPLNFTRSRHMSNLQRFMSANGITNQPNESPKPKPTMSAPGIAKEAAAAYDFQTKAKNQYDTFRCRKLFDRRTRD